MADPKISKIEIHEYAYTLNDLGKDYNGFNLVYEPGSTVHSKGYILRILTDAGIVGEYAGGSAIDYATLPRFTHYLIGSSALERERIWRRSTLPCGTWRASSMARRSTSCSAATRTACPAMPAHITATSKRTGYPAPRRMPTLPMITV